MFLKSRFFLNCLLVLLVPLSSMAADFSSLYINMKGEGEPVLIVHGGPGFDSHHLAPLEALLSDYRVIIYDQRGSGYSFAEVSAESITMQQFVEDLEYVRQQSGFDKVHLLGNSFGGVIAGYYAKAYPEHVKSLILLASVPLRLSGFSVVGENIYSRFTKEDEMELDRLFNSKAYQNHEIGAFEEYFNLFFSVYFYDRTMADQLVLGVSQQTVDTFDEIYSLMYNDLGDFDLLPALENFNRPTLILHGSHDPFPYQEMQVVHNILPKSEIQVYQNAGHFLYLETPQRLQEDIDEFIDDHDDDDSEDEGDDDQ